MKQSIGQVAPSMLHYKTMTINDATKNDQTDWLLGYSNYHTHKLAILFISCSHYTDWPRMYTLFANKLYCSYCEV